MSTPTAADRKIADKLAIIDSGLQAALRAIDGILDADIRATSYANGSSLFKELRGKINSAISTRKNINYFK